MCHNKILSGTIIGVKWFFEKITENHFSHLIKNFDISL